MPRQIPKNGMFFSLAHLIAFILPSELDKIHEIQKELNIKFTEVTV